MSSFPKLYVTFDDVLKELDKLDKDNLHGWMDLISKYYLSSKELKIYNSLKNSYTLNVGQRELAIFCNINQSYLSVLFKNLTSKLRVFYDILSSTSLSREYYDLYAESTALQKRYLTYIFAGYPRPTVVSILNVSDLAASRHVYRMHKRLEARALEYPTLLSYMTQYKHYKRMCVN